MKNGAYSEIMKKAFGDKKNHLISDTKDDREPPKKIEIIEKVKTITKPGNSKKVYMVRDENGCIHWLKDLDEEAAREYYKSMKKELLDDIGDFARNYYDLMNEQGFSVPKRESFKKDNGYLFLYSNEVYPHLGELINPHLSNELTFNDDIIKDFAEYLMTSLNNGIEHGDTNFTNYLYNNCADEIKNTFINIDFDLGGEIKKVNEFVKHRIITLAEKLEVKDLKEKIKTINTDKGGVGISFTYFGLTELYYDKIGNDSGLINELEHKINVFTEALKLKDLELIRNINLYLMRGLLYKKKKGITSWNTLYKAVRDEIIKDEYQMPNELINNALRKRRNNKIIIQELPV